MEGEDIFFILKRKMYKFIYKKIQMVQKYHL